MHFMATNWKWAKPITFSVLDVDYDIIIGLPFAQSIVVIYENWAQRRKIFRTSTGTTHRWYGKDHIAGPLGK